MTSCDIDWIFDLKPDIQRFLYEMKSEKVPGYYRYSYSGDLYNENYHWNVGSSVFALKIYYTLGIKHNKDIETAVDYLKTFHHKNGQIYDDLVFRKSFLRNMLSSFRHRNFINLYNEQYKRAETRQCYSALMLYDKLPDDIILNLPQNEKEIETYLAALNWLRPWGGGSHFSHLMFFYNLALRTKMMTQETFKYLTDYAIKWVNRLQNSNDGSWYLGVPDLQQKINGAMKIITGLIAVDKVGFDCPEKLIDLCLSATNNRHACDNFNIILILNYASKLLGGDYCRSEIEEFVLKRLSIYRNHYHNDKNGFSFYSDRANDIYYAAKITKGINEPDIHGTVLFLWGISIIAQLLGVENKLAFKEFKT